MGRWRGVGGEGAECECVAVSAARSSIRPADSALEPADGAERLHHKERADARQLG